MVEDVQQDADLAAAAQIRQNAIEAERMRLEHRDEEARAALRQAERDRIRRAAREVENAVFDAQINLNVALPRARPKGAVATATKNRLILEGDSVVLIKEDVLSKMTLKAFFEAFVHESKPQFDGLLPSGTRFVQRSGDIVRFLVELEPSIQTVRQVGTKAAHQVALPWQYFYFAFKAQGPNKANVLWTAQDVRVFWMRNRYRTQENTLAIYARLPNIYQNSGKICFGNTAPDSTLPLHERIEAVINDFFAPESEFNGDLGWNLPYAYTNFRDWAKASKDDPLCFLHWMDFTERNQTVIPDLFAVANSAFSENSFTELAYAFSKLGGANF